MLNRVNGTRCSLVTLAVWGALMSPAYSAGISELDEVLVKASRDNSTESETKRSVAVITRQQLDEQQPDSVAQALKYQPNIEVGGGPRTSNQQPVVRGLSGNQVLQLVDGARQNFNSGHRGAYQIDPELLEQIDVIKGPASSLWGSGAIGGVVSQTTRDAQDLLAPEQGFGAYVKQGHATVSDQNKTSGAIYGRLGEQVDLLINGYYSDQNNIRLGNGESLSDSSERTSGGMIKVGWQLDENQRLTLSQRRHDIDGTVPGNPAETDAYDNPLVDRDSKSDHTALNYQLDPDSEWLDLDATLYYNRTNVDEHRLIEQQRDNIKYRSEGFSVVNRSQLANIDWVYGADGFRDKSQGTREGDRRPIPADGRTQVVGSFVKADLSLAENWTLMPGLRYDHFKTEAKNLEDSKRSEHEWSKSLALSWQANDRLEVIARYDEAFRAPTSEELYTTGTHFNAGPHSNTFVAAPDLKPEKAKNKELLVRTNFNDVLLDNDRLRVNGSVFKNDITDFIEQILYDYLTWPDGQVIVTPDGDKLPLKTTYTNVGKAEIKGGELNAMYEWQDLDLGLSYGRTHSKNKTTGGTLSGVPRAKWVASAGYWLLGDQLRLGTQVTHSRGVTFAGENKKTGSAEVNEYNSYTLWDLEARWFGRGAVDGLEVGVAVDNLTDRYYRRAFSELYDPGRNVKLDALYRF